MINAREVREHHAYDDFELWNDVVILKLSTHLVEGTNIRHANLPPPGHFIPSGLTVSIKCQNTEFLVSNVIFM